MWNVHKYSGLFFFEKFPGSQCGTPFLGRASYMVIFHGYVKLPEGRWNLIGFGDIPQFGCSLHPFPPPEVASSRASRFYPWFHDHFTSEDIRKLG